MAFYENKTELLGGALVLFQRNLSVAVPNAERHRTPTWYMRLKISGRAGYVTKSTKLTVYEDAYEFAKSELLRLTQAARLGHSLSEYTFEQHWNDWYSRNVKNGTWKESRQKWHFNYAARYFKPYFTNKKGESILLNDITPDVALSYWDWRITFWERAEGQKLQKYNPKRRSAKTRVTANTKAKPSLKTLQMEQTALNQIFRDARERGRSQQEFRFRVPNSGEKKGRRPHFNPREYASLVRNLRSYKDCAGVFSNDKVNAWHLLQRQQMYYFVQFLANSGLRVGEAREMRWADITFDAEVEGRSEKIATIRVSKHTKNGVGREVQGQPRTNIHLREWFAITPFKKPSDYVWFGQTKKGVTKSTPFNDLNKSFQSILARIPYQERIGGLLNSADGDRRSLYSLRHTYATFRITKGNVSVYDLSLNMGCRVIQIEQHYSHALAELRRPEITKTKDYSKGGKANTEGKDATEALGRLISLFEQGKLSEENFVRLMSGFGDQVEK